MMIWDILNTLIHFLPNLIIGAGPFFAFKGMGSGSQSGKLLFKSINGENISSTDTNTCLVLKDEMVADSLMCKGVVAVGSGPGITSSKYFVTQCMLESDDYYKRGINLPIINRTTLDSDSNPYSNWDKNYGLYQGGLIISTYLPSNRIYSLKGSKSNSIINSSCSCIVSKNDFLPVEYTSIINSSNSFISQESKHATIIGGRCNTICRSYQSTVLSGYRNRIYDYKSKYCEQSRINFIGGGISNRILNTSELPPYTKTQCLNISVGNSILIGFRNTITSGFYSSILSGTCNLISLSASNIDSNSNKGNLIGSGYKNCIMSCSQKMNKLYCGSFQSILNGKANIISNLSYSNIANGYKNCIEGVYGQAEKLYSSMVLNGCCNVICGFQNSAILNGYCNSIESTKSKQNLQNSVIISGCKNCIKSSNATIINGCSNYSDSAQSTIIGGFENCISGSQQVTIVSGTGSCISFSKDSTIISNQSKIRSSNESTIVGEYCNYICGKFFESFNNTNKSNVIIANCCNTIISLKSENSVSGLQLSFIVGGSCNLIESNVANSRSVGIIGGCKNRTLRSAGSVIIGGCCNHLGLTSSFYSSNSVQISSIIGGFCNRINFSLCDTSVNDTQTRQTSIIGGYKNSFTDHTSICNNVIVGGSNMSGYIINNEGNPNAVNNFTQTDIISVRGNVYVTDGSGNRCQGLSYLNLSKGTTINSICIIKGIVITMSYT